MQRLLAYRPDLSYTREKEATVTDDEPASSVPVLLKEHCMLNIYVCAVAMPTCHCMLFVTMSAVP